MAQSKHTGRTGPLLTRTGLIAAFLATGIVASEQSAQADGLVRCWGWNPYGQCNTPSDLGPCSSVAGGLYHSIAIRIDGTARCWGRNVDGSCNTPADLGPCSQVAVGHFHSIALRNDGNVRCWGWNRNGECTTPADLGPCSNIAAGSYHSIAIRIDGAVRCWGKNDYLQCNTPGDLGSCTSVAGGYGYSVAIRSNGTVRCWGKNDYGQCSTPSDLGTCSRVAAGFSHTIALRSDGIVKCWGQNSNFQCNTPAGLGTCISIAVRGNASTAIRSDGSVQWWGQYNNPTQWFDTPADVGNCSTIGGTGGHSLAIQIPPVKCTGDLNYDNQVNGSDLGVVLGQWATSGGTTGADLNEDGTVNGADLGLILGGWGPCAVRVPSWATLVEAQPDPLVVPDSTIRAAISASGFAWRIRDTATGMEMLLVPPGTFTMGCTASNQYGCNSDENPVHSVTHTYAFYIGRYEVTQSQWVTKMGSNPSAFQGASYPDASNRPVERVSLNTIKGYLSATGMRLPTEAEWEYASRAGTTTAFNNGSNSDITVVNIAWYNGNSGNQTHAVGGKAANALGLYDIAGNVFEWVTDCYGSTYYASSPSVNPLGAGCSVVTPHAVRGGSLGSDANTLRSSFRGGSAPANAYSDLGFRVARTP